MNKYVLEGGPNKEEPYKGNDKDEYYDNNRGDDDEDFYEEEYFDSNEPGDTINKDNNEIWIQHSIVYLE